MSIFDLLFLLTVLASVITLAVVAVFAIRGQRSRALRILRLYVACAAGYLMAGIAVSFLKPQRVVPVGEPWCFDDWCLTAEKVSKTPGAGARISYQVGLRISSQARRVTQRARGAWLYLIDDRGHLYSPDPDPNAIPLDVLLRPGESVRTSRVFEIPPGVRTLGLVTGHGGPYCGPMDILIIGSAGCLFQKPAMIRIE
jgi:hypothetical protein